MPWEVWKGKKQNLAAPRHHRCDVPPLNAGKGWHAIESDQWRCPVCLSIHIVGYYGGRAKREWGESDFGDQLDAVETELAQDN